MTGTPIVLGFDFGGTKIAVATCDLSGARLETVVVDSCPAEGAESAFARGVAAAHDTLKATGPNHELVSVGAVTFGIPFDDRVELAPAIPGWQELPLGHLLHAEFPGVPLRLSTDVKAAAAAECRWGALAGCDPSIYLNLGTGLGVAIIVHGQVLAGAHHAAGEIGYNVRLLADIDPSAPERVPLENAVSGGAIAAIGSLTVGHPVTAAEVFQLAVTMPTAAAVVESFVRELAVHLVNLAVAIDPVRIVVGGGMVHSWQQIEPGLRLALDAATPYPPELTTARFPYDAPLLGALTMGIAATRRATNAPATAANTTEDALSERAST